tara:strand:+ start:359 stop:535 length:177 start_codon:yes stop_codon:yes gene_type:complete
MNYFEKLHEDWINSKGHLFVRAKKFGFSSDEIRLIMNNVKRPRKAAKKKNVSARRIKK